jgi:glycerol-3-phosphate dehydrogenase
VKRNPTSLRTNKYDLVVVGGGIFGACLAWDAVRRGLSVALVEKGDFSQATSANSFKIVHGGIRYLQHGDFPRIRESSRERRAFLRIAPHLVHPLPIVIPTYGHGKNGKAILRLGVMAYDLSVLDRNRGIKDPGRCIPAGRTLSRAECLKRFPGIEQEALTGGVLIHDAQMYNPPRLALSFLRSAVDAGAEVANYVEAIGFVASQGRVTGVKARDVLSGDEFEIQAQSVINAAGPWAGSLLERGLGVKLQPKLTFSRDACMVVKKKLFAGSEALAVMAQTADPDALLSRSHRHLFVAPWREDYTLIGTWHVVFEGSPDEFTVTEQDIRNFLDELKAGYSVDLDLSDVSMWNAGLVLFGENQPGQENLSYGKRSLIIDHQEKHQIENLISVIGVRYTTARGIAEKAMNLLLRKLGRKSPPSDTDVTPVYGGDIECFADFSENVLRQAPHGLDADLLLPLLRNYGSKYQDVLSLIDENSRWSETVGSTSSLKAEVVHAVRHEMAQTLGDVIFRRTDIGTGENPGGVAVESCAEIMASELGWNADRVEREIRDLNARFSDFLGEALVEVSKPESE